VPAERPLASTLQLPALAAACILSLAATAPAAEPLQTLSLGGWVAAVRFSPDGGRLAVASADNKVTLFDVSSGQAAATLAGHSDYVAAVAFAPGGRRLATGSYDHTAGGISTPGGRWRDMPTPAAR
jgi:WD40 repeat protein